MFVEPDPPDFMTLEGHTMKKFWKEAVALGTMILIGYIAYRYVYPRLDKVAAKVGA